MLQDCLPRARSHIAGVWGQSGVCGMDSSQRVTAPHLHKQKDRECVVLSF